MSLALVERYFNLPAAYREELGGLRWSDARDALELSCGQTFAFAAEVVAFLEGYASQRPLAHFAHLMHLFAILRDGQGRRHNFTALHRAYQEAGRPTRNAGVLCARLLPDLPVEPDAPTAEELVRWLAITSPVTGKSAGYAVQRPLSPEEVETYLASALPAWPAETLLHWLRHGQGPPEGGARLAAAVLESRLRPLATVLAEAGRHDRLAGAMPFVDRLVGALALPQRRLAPPQLPLGGYADVTTRGAPEGILPAQLALEPEEFIRRFAENELLYYRREEPHARTREELVVLLDQGVRTWGGVRLLLTAGVFALARLAQRRRVTFRLGVTSAPGTTIDPRTTAPTAFAELLAGSDLGAHPGLALERVLEEPAGVDRDVVLLTHPRNLAEPDVGASARRVVPGVRLFAVSADAEGAVELAELRRGAPVVLTRFRLDLSTPQPRPRAAAAGTWTGDVEPVPFPFRFGVGAHHDPFLFCFDEAGQRVLTATQGGLLIATRTDGTGWEVLPRPWHEGRVLTGFEVLLGCAGGFAVCGSAPGLDFAAHYDFAARRVHVHTFATGGRIQPEWRFFGPRHALLFRRGQTFIGIDLRTGNRYSFGAEGMDWVAFGPLRRHGERYRLPLAPRPHSDGQRWSNPAIVLDGAGGELAVDGAMPAWQPFVIRADGRPALRHHQPVRADLRGQTLALSAVTAKDRRPGLWVVRGPEGFLLHWQQLAAERDRFALSSDGNLLAVQRGPCQLEVREVGWAGPPQCVTPTGGFHHDVAVHLEDCWLALCIERALHLFRWDAGVLVARHSAVEIKKGGNLSRNLLPAFLRYDDRFRGAARGPLIAAVDAYGQAFLFEPAGELVCAFFAFRGKFAAWAPDGACLGDEALLGRPPTPGAAEHIEQALLRAWRRGAGGES
jgi:hypothetical protein